MRKTQAAISSKTHEDTDEFWGHRRERLGIRSGPNEGGEGRGVVAWGWTVQLEEGGRDEKSRERERADRTGEDRTFVSDGHALNDRFATPLTDIEGRSHYGRMEPESELILLPPSFEHVDQDHLCSLIGLSPCSRAPR